LKNKGITHVGTVRRYRSTFFDPRSTLQWPNSWDLPALCLYRKHRNRFQPASDCQPRGFTNMM